MGKQNEDYIYPVDIEVRADVGSGGTVMLREPKQLSWGNYGAVKVRVIVDSCKYQKEDVRESLREAFQKLLEYYC